MKNLFFPVEKIPLEDLGFKLPVPTDVNHAIVGNVNGSKKVISFCSEDYGVLPNLDLATEMDKVLSDFGVSSTHKTGMNHRDSIFRMEWILKGAEVTIQNDRLAPRIYIYNSYNRRQKFSVSFGIMRLICTNGLTAMVEETITRRLHSSGIDAFDAIHSLAPKLDQLMNDFDLFTEPFEDLSTMRVPNIDARYEEILENTSYPAGLIDIARDRIMKELSELRANATDYMVYNSLNYALVHEPTYIGRKGDSIDREVLNYMLG